MGQEKLYIEKELSWLSFNERVLQEAADKSNPLIERMRFLGIYSNNLDEFYKVRFAELKRRIIISEEQGSNSHSRHLLGKIQSRVLKADQEFDGLYNELLLEMARNQIFLINERQLSVNQQNWLRHYFKQYLRQHITPILINPDTDLVQFLKDDYTYLAVEIIRGDTIRYALLEIPSDKVPRFVNLPPEAPRRRKPMILLDNILRYCLDDIFKGFFDYDALNAYSMKMTRDAEYDLVHEMEASLMELMSSSLKQRLTAEPVRFVYQRDMPNALVEVLREKLTISRYDSIVPGGRYHNFKDFINFPNVGKANLVNKPLPRLRHIWFDKAQFRNGFDAIRERDVLLYYPYHTFEHVLELLRQASFDPSVLAIKINIYRVAKDSRIIDSMIHAAHNGKKVTVVVELQARFDEEANIHWAKRLTEAGVHVIFSAPGLKIHAKLFLISRKENGEVVRYAHIGTGNFNEKTARLYTDYSLLTADARITNEVRRVFNFIENPYRPVTFDYLMVSPQNSRRLLYELVDREIANAQQGLPSGITLKLNNLVDKGLVDRLYAASSSGVPVNLLVRGMCSLIPNLEGISDNIRAISIVDRYLEHDRVYIFENGGDKKVYLSSADWMTRNLDNRVEAYAPVYDEAVRRELRRGGQVYYLHNKVESIERVAARLQAQIPEAKVGFGHGKMPEGELSEVWRRVMEQEINVLVCTTIIETGVDVPNVNTIIIEDADHMGLSQLHQIRGRVGRSSRRAYAYLTFTRNKVLSEISQKRLAAIREFTEFGSGFKIAMRDLELRGAGNILGGEQHGHMETVGYDMYLRLLGEAVSEEKGEEASSYELECLVDVQVQAHIPEGYIESLSQRLEIYRRISDIRSQDDAMDVLDELIDRFGEPPASVKGLIDVALIRNTAASLGIYEIKQNAGALLLYQRKLDMEFVSRLIGAFKKRVLVNAGAKPYISVKLQAGDSPLETLRQVFQA